MPGPSDSVKKEALKTENQASKAGERTERVKAVITPFEGWWGERVKAVSTGR